MASSSRHCVVQEQKEKIIIVFDSNLSSLEIFIMSRLPNTNWFLDVIFKEFRSISAAIILGVSFIFSPSLTNFDVAQAQEINREEIEKIIRSYLLENPEIMIEVQTALETKQAALTAAKQADTLKTMNEQIYHSKNQMIIGDPEAKITIVEFFDYNCGFCKRAMGDMYRIVEENSDVKFVMKEFPVLGENSMQAHRVSLALINKYPEKYDEFHRALLGATGGKNGARALQIAVELGANEAILTTEMNNPQLTEAIQEVYSIADGLGITGTPSYIIGDKIIFGAVGYDRLMPQVNNLRKCGKASCG